MRAALIGCGKIAFWHRSALVRAGVDLVATVDRDPQRAALTAAPVPGCRPFTDVAEMLREARPDVVHVLTPPSTHAALAIQAAQAGVHALVEKPVAYSVDEADAMLAAAAEHGTHLIAVHNYLFKPSVLKARRLVAEGAVGDVVHVEAYYGQFGEHQEKGAHWSSDLPGGSFTNYLPHLVYLQEAFLGELRGVSGVSVGTDPATGEQSELTVLVEGANGPGVMTVSKRTQPYAKYVRIFGTRGIVHADLVSEVTAINRARRVPRLISKVLFNLEVMPQFGVGTVVNSARFATKSLPNMPDLHTFVAELYAALDAGQAPPEGARGTDGRKVMQVLEQVWERMPAPAVPPTQAELTPAAARPAPLSRIEHRVADAGVGGKVLVTGAGGYLGRHLVAALYRCGADVRALVRDAGRVPAEVRSQAEVVFGNLVDEDAVRRAMEGVDLVVHCAAVTTNNVPWAVHQQTNVDGTRVVYEAARAAGVKRLVHISSVIVYGTAPQTNGNGNGAVPESAPYPAQPDRWAYYLRSKVAAEQVVREAPGGGPEVVVLRPGLIYGPGAEGPVTRGLVQLGSVRLTLGRGRNALPLTYVDNVVDGILLALTSPNAAGGAFNLVDDPQPPAREAAKQADAVTQGGVRFVGLPPAPLKVLASRLEAKAAEANAETPPKLSNFQIASATRDVRYATTRAREDLGWEPEIGLEEGLRRTLG